MAELHDWALRFTESFKSNIYGAVTEIIQGECCYQSMRVWRAFGHLHAPAFNIHHHADVACSWRGVLKRPCSAPYLGP